MQFYLLKVNEINCCSTNKLAAKIRLQSYVGYAATRLYNPLGGAYYRSFGCVLWNSDSRERRTPGELLLATGL